MVWRLTSNLNLRTGQANIDKVRSGKVRKGKVWNVQDKSGHVTGQLRNIKSSQDRSSQDKSSQEILTCSYNCILIWWHAHLVASLHICILGNLHTFNIPYLYSCIFAYFHTFTLAYLYTFQLAQLHIHVFAYLLTPGAISIDCIKVS